MATEEKSNELTAIPKLLEILALAKCTVTIDAMGTHRDIAEAIHGKGADYFLPVKENQPLLLDDIKLYAESDCLTHGRHIYRRVEVCNDVSWLETAREWKQLSSIICVTRKGEREGREIKETAYYISSRKCEAEEAAKCIQGHWAIENNLHWSLDTAFNEDESLVYKGHAQENLSLVRKFAQKMLKSETSFKGGSIRRKSIRAAMLNEYAQIVLKLGVI